MANVLNGVATALLATVAVTGAVTGAASAEGRIAYFAAASENGFNQATYEGIQEMAAERGYETEIFDGQFDASVQFAQIEDVLASGNFDGFIIAPNDNVGVSGAVEQVIAAGFPIVTVLFPIGPEMNSLEPQIEGLTATVASPPVPGATLQAEAVVDFCADKDPCNVIILIGGKIFPFDNLRLETYEDVLARHDNIDVVAVGEGYYSPEAGLNAMTDMLQANPDVHVVLSNADQHMAGAEIALDAAGMNVADMYIMGGGASDVGVQAVRDGRWDATMAYFPKTMGALAMEQIANAIEGQPVTVSINMDEVGPIQALIDAAALEANPDFVAEWQQ